MRSQKMHRLRSSRQVSKKDRQGSYSPKLSTSVSEKCLLTRSYKNQPIPAQIKRRLIAGSRKVNFDSSSDEQEYIMPVQQVQQGDTIEKKARKLPKIKIVGDWDEFSERRNSLKSEFLDNRSHRKRAHSVQSVESLKLPLVIQDRKEDDDLYKIERCKLSQMKDQNEFNLKRGRRSSSSYTEVASKVESVEFNQLSSQLPELIPEMQAEQTKSVKLPNQKSIITTQIEKLIVDQLDEKKRKKEEMQKDIQSIIEQKNEDDYNTEKLRQSLEKFDTQYEYMKMHADGFQMSNRTSEKQGNVIHQQEEEKQQSANNGTIQENHHE